MTCVWSREKIYDTFLSDRQVFFFFIPEQSDPLHCIRTVSLGLNSHSQDIEFHQQTSKEITSDMYRANMLELINRAHIVQISAPFKFMNK